MRLADLVVLNAERAARRAVAFVTDLGGGAQRVVTATAVAGDALSDAIDERLRSGKSGIVRHDGRDLFVTVHVPPVRLVVVGAVHITQALVEMTRLVEIDAIVVDPRTAFATPDRFPGVDLRAQWPDEVLPAFGLDAFTAVALLTHDPKIDDQALVAALRSPCFYIGALGSRATHGRRLERMRAEGFDEQDLARIRAPIGLDIGALSPPEIAVSILGEVIAAQGRKRKRTESRPTVPETGQVVKFGRVAVGAADGVILAHAVKAPGIDLKKGETVGPRQIAALERAGISSLIGAMLEPGDVGENAAALQLASHVAGVDIRLDRAFTGRCNLLSDAAGLVEIDIAAVDAVNAIDEAITLATLSPYQAIEAGEMVATVKIIPFAVSGACLARCIGVAAGAVRIARYRPLRVGVASTLLPGLKTSTVAKTLAVLEGRLSPASSVVAEEIRVPHDARKLADAIRRLAVADLVVVFGASAVTDRRDVVPVAIELAGGKVEHLGMPVDPGNLLVLAHLVRDGVRVPVIGAPGCARSAKENGFDFVLRRFLAGLTVDATALRRMGVGGLLNEIATRPQLRQIPDG